MDDEDDSYSQDYDSTFLQIEKADGSSTLIPYDTIDILIAFFEHKTIMQGNFTKH